MPSFAAQKISLITNSGQNLANAYFMMYSLRPKLSLKDEFQELCCKKVI